MEKRSPVLGLLMLDTAFPRLPGDIGHPATFATPVKRLTIASATSRQVVLNRADGLLPGFVDGARRLQDSGVDLISTSCGFLALFQAALQNSVRVPLITSSLCAIADIEKNGQRAAVLTISRETLSAGHLQAAGARSGIPVGAPRRDGEFYARILGNDTHIDPKLCEEELVAASIALVEEHPQTTVLVLECTNMEPYAAAIRTATGRLTVSLTTILEERLSSMSAQ